MSKTEDEITVSDIYGDKSFNIALTELRQLIRTREIVTSQVLPKQFYKSLLTKFTSKFLLFFNIFRAVPLKAIAYEWESTKASMLNVLRSSLRRGPDSSMQGSDYTKTISKDELIEKVQYLWSQNEELEVVTSCLRGWFDYLGDDNNFTIAGFKSLPHFKMVLSKSLVELATNVCLSQKGYFFTEGKRDIKEEGEEGKEGENERKEGQFDNRIIERKAFSDGFHESKVNPVTFLSCTFVNFGDIEATLREAPKYFVRVPVQSSKLQESQSHRGWKYFQDGKEDELENRISLLYQAVFDAAESQV